MSAVTISVDDELTVDAAIEAAIDRVLGPSWVAKPKQTCALMNISLSTYNRAVRAGLIEVVPRGDYWGATRPVLRPLMKYGLGSITGKSAA